MSDDLIDFTQEEIDELLQHIDLLTEEERAELLVIAETLEGRQMAKKCRDDLLEFCKHMQPEFVVGHHHRILCELLMKLASGEEDRIAVNIPPRHGKKLAHSTPVLTTTGWKTHGELCVGDEVFHPSGEPTKVIALSKDGPADCDHLVEFTNGEKLLAHANHEWVIHDQSAKVWRTVETRWFLEKVTRGPNVGNSRKLWSGNKGARGSRARYRMPKVEQLQFDTKALPLDPYLLGVWLGDGSTGKPAISMCAEDEPFVTSEFVKHGYTVSATHVHNITGVLTVSFGGQRSSARGGASLLTRHLQKTGVFTKKTIPELYLRSDVEQRLQLLAGLIDTDGHVESDTGRVRFVTGQRKLAEAVLDLCTTLGFRPYLTKQAPVTSSSGIVGKVDVHTVGFQPTCDIPCRIPRKRNSQRALYRSIAVSDVRLVKAEEGRCIQVASPDGLYLAGKSLMPTHNSNIISIHFPSWFLGKYPDKQIIMASHTGDLAVDFGRKVRNQINSDKYRQIFPNVSLSTDSKSAGRWNTNAGGTYYACGVGSALAGRGADLLIIDDPHSEQDILNGNYEVFDRAYEWFTFGARTRLMPAGRVALVQTRWHQDDLTGRLVKEMGREERADQYHVVELPAILTLRDEETGEETQKALWPEWFSLEALLNIKAGMPVFQWNAQYQQNPTGEEGAIVKREWWRIWRAERPPKVEFIIMCLDAAAEKHNRADFTAITTWGVFFNEESQYHNIILLNAIKRRYEFPELKAKAKLEYEEWEPDSFIVEKKSAGTQLYQELRRMGIIVQDYTPHRGSGDKVARLNSVADIFKEGYVWAPETRWAEEVIEEVAAFPYASNDDLTDTVTMALMRFRQGGFLQLPTDYKDDPVYFKSQRGKRFY